MSVRQSGLGRTRADRGHHKAIAELAAGTADLALKHRELVAQSQHFGAKPGLGPASNDEHFE